MVLWMKTESLLVKDEYQLPKSKWSLKKRMLIFTITYLTLAIVEHVCYQTSEVNLFLFEVAACNRTDYDLVGAYITKHFNNIITELPFRYNNVLGIFLEYLNFSYTFSWNFLNLFIILNSIGIAFLYEQVYQKSQNFKGLLVSEQTWAEIRYQHVQVSELFQIVNMNLNEMLLVACFNDGYFILSQMINITA